MTPVAASAKKDDRKAAAAAAALPAQSAVGESCAPDSYVQAPQGLFPAPMHPKDAKGIAKPPGSAILSLFPAGLYCCLRSRELV